jgi:antitoxin YefM
MNILTFSEARASLKTVMDNVCNDHSPAVVTRVGGDHVVLMSLSDFNSIEETLYLLSSKNNASALMKSISQLRAGETRQHDFIGEIDVPKAEGKEQSKRNDQ